VGTIPALVAIWANIQSLFVIAPAVVFLALLAAVAAWIRAPRPARDPDRPIDLLVALALAAGAAFLNPYGARALRLPFEQFFGQLGGVSLISRTIAEFQPTLSGYLVTPALVAFGLFAVLLAAALIADLRRVTLFEFLVALATLYVALRARRNIPVFVVATAPMLLRHAAAAWRTVAPPPAAGRADFRFLAPAAVTVAGLAIVAAAATDRLHLIRPTERWFGSGLIPHYFPDRSARFLATSGWPGNVFHSLSIGGFLIHAWHGDRRVFIDGRNEPYLDGVLETYLGAVADPARFEEAARRYQVTTVLWPHQRAIEGRALLAHLQRNGGWVRVRLDPAASVYLRTDLAPHLSPDSLPPPPAGEASLHAALAAELDAEPFAGPPIRDTALAEYFSAIGDPAGAEYFYRRALARLPDSPPILHDCALAVERQGRSAEARDLHTQALRADPGFAPSHAALGSFLIEAGDLAGARRHLDAAWKSGNRQVRLMAARARLFEKEGRTPEAVVAWQEAIQAHPRNAPILRAAGVFFAQAGRPESAVPIFVAARAIDPAPETAAALIETLARLGRLSEALIVGREAGRAAAARIETPAGGASAGAPSCGADRQVLIWAARLEARSGEADRAAAWLGVLARAGLWSEDERERDPELRAISPAR
jgi:Tfp pilus assembly protein PilF